MPEEPARSYVHKRPTWAEVVMQKYYPDWPNFECQVPIFDVRGFDKKTIDSIGILYFTRVMPRADVLAWRPGELLLVEFSKKPDPKKVYQVQGYIDALKNDSLREHWRNAKIQATLVTHTFDVRVEEACRRAGFKYIVEPEPPAPEEV